MIDEEGTLLLTNETKIPDDMIDKIKKIVIDTSLQGIVFENIFEFENTFKSTKYLINLEEVDFTNYTFHIMYSDSFISCKKLKSIELSVPIKILNWRCFYGCEKVESVILYGVEIICNYAFGGCISLKYLFISDAIKEINEAAFIGIPKEQEIVIICLDRFYDYFKIRFPNASINDYEYVLK